MAGAEATVDQAGRRGFLRGVGIGAASTLAWLRGGRASAAEPGTGGAPTAVGAVPPPLVRVVAEGFPAVAPGAARRLDLAPARWLWLPSQRTLANTVVLFRRDLELDGPAARATGWISADSRYRLSVNGRRVQFGPAPCDPRSYDADPVDLATFLRPGANTLGVEVLFYGVGEGTWPSGKPGLLFALQIEEQGGRKQTVLSDASWRVLLDRAHRPGQFKRWYLRTLQEEFDARLRPRGGTSRASLPARRGRRRSCSTRRPTGPPPPAAITST